MKKTLSMILVLAMCAALLCGVGGTALASEEFEGLTEATTISLAANPIGQSSYQQAAEISDAFVKAGSLLTVTAEATNGYEENPSLVANGEVEIAFTNNLMLADAYNATGVYEGMEPEQCLGVICPATRPTSSSPLTPTSPKSPPTPSAASASASARWAAPPAPMR